MLGRERRVTPSSRAPEGPGTHLKDLAPRVAGPESLERDLSLHNDVLFSLLPVCQLVIDIAGELAGRRGQRFEDYTEAIRSLGSDDHIQNGTRRQPGDAACEGDHDGLIVRS